MPLLYDAYIYHDYYKLQVETGVMTNKIPISKLHIKHKFMAFNLVLYDDYPSAATT